MNRFAGTQVLVRKVGGWRIPTNETSHAAGANELGTGERGPVTAANDAQLTAHLVYDGISDVQWHSLLLCLNIKCLHRTF